MKPRTVSTLLLLLLCAFSMAQSGGRSPHKYWDRINAVQRLDRLIERAMLIGELDEALRLYRQEQPRLCDGYRNYDAEARILAELGLWAEAKIVYDLYLTHQEMVHTNLDDETRREDQLLGNIIIAELSGRALEIPPLFSLPEALTSLRGLAQSSAGGYHLRLADKIAAHAEKLGLEPEKRASMRRIIDKYKAKQRDARREAGLPPL